jgi:hypothetical protein
LPAKEELRRVIYRKFHLQFGAHEIDRRHRRREGTARRKDSNFMESSRAVSLGLVARQARLVQCPGIRLKASSALGGHAGAGGEPNRIAGQAKGGHAYAAETH